MAQTIEIESNVKLERLLTTNPEMEKKVIAIMRKIIKQARKEVATRAESAIKNDPRKTAHAIRSSVYKALIGGQLNILSSRRAGSRGSFEKRRTLVPGQRGGNRIPRSADTERMESYQGFDRAFVLRWINSGTAQRTSRYGNRGSITARNWFGPAASSALGTAAENLDKLITELIAKELSA